MFASKPPHPQSRIINLIAMRGQQIPVLKWTTNTINHATLILARIQKTDEK